MQLGPLMVMAARARHDKVFILVEKFLYSL